MYLLDMQISKIPKELDYLYLRLLKYMLIATHPHHSFMFHQWEQGNKKLIQHTVFSRLTVIRRILLISAYLLLSTYFFAVLFTRY